MVDNRIVTDIKKEKALQSKHNSNYNMSASLPHNTIGNKRRTDDSDSYNPAAKRRRVSLMPANFNGYSFFPVDEDELLEGDKRCSLLNNLSVSLLGHQMDQSVLAPVDRRRSSTLSILSFLADTDLFGEDLIPQYFPTDNAAQRENNQRDRRRSSTLSFLSLLAKEDLFDNDIVPQCFLCESTEDNIAQNENILRSMIIADELTSTQNSAELTFPPTTTPPDNQYIITHTSSDASDDSDEEGLIPTGAIQPYEAKSIIPSDLDVLFGRGQKINKHPGNQRFRELVNQMKPIYFAQGSSKKKKHALSQQVMETVFAYGGRFLEVENASSSINESTDLVFIEVDKKRARKKCSQRLRETR